MEGHLVEGAPPIEATVLQEWLRLIAVAATVTSALFIFLFIRERRKRPTPWTPRASYPLREEQNRDSTATELWKWLRMLEERVNSISTLTVRLQSRIEKLENESRSRPSPESSGWMPPDPSLALPGRPLPGPPVGGEPVRAHVTFPVEPLTYDALPSPADVAEEVLSELNARGGASEVARVSGLKSWISQRRPHVQVEAILSSGDFWPLILITHDLKRGIVIPTLDTVVGPGEVFKWFDCSRYDGTQPLMRTDVVLPAEALRDPRGSGWLVARKGRIDRTRREGGG